MTRDETVAALKKAGVVAVIRARNADEAVSVAVALAAGGVVAAEVTFTTAGAADAIRALKARHDAGDLPESFVLGAGTVVYRAQAEEAVEAGARYLVSPHLALPVADVAQQRKVAFLPGALTPGEVFAAREAGGDVVKVFPAARMGASYLKDLRGPYPTIPLMPTGGVTAENLHEWLAAGAVAVGTGSDLVDAKAVAAGDWGALTERARRYAYALDVARG